MRLVKVVFPPGVLRSGVESPVYFIESLLECKPSHNHRLPSSGDSEVGPAWGCSDEAILRNPELEWMARRRSC